MDGCLHAVVDSIQRCAAVGILDPRFGGSGAPDSHQTGLTDLPKDWMAAIPCDAAT